MELGAAGSLRDLLYRTSLQNVTWSKRVVLATGVACGVDFLHSQKPPIIHFDLKSANVVLDMALVPKARAPRAGASMPSTVRRLKLCCPPLQVCDFGISSILGQLDGQGALRGTPRYMARAPRPRASRFVRPRADMRPIGRALLPSSQAPEVARQQAITNFPAVDCYGLGCVLHDLVHVNTDAGAHARLVSAGLNPGAPLSDVTSNSVADWAVVRTLFEREVSGFAPAVAPHVPPPRAQLVRSCLAVDPEARRTVERVRVTLAQLADSANTW
jgi:serine/threonine protein kinase